MSKQAELIKLVEQMKELQARFRAESSSLLQGAFTEIFTTYPDLIALRWRQGAPSFNDGDPCVFRLRDVWIKHAGAAEAYGEASEDEGGDYDDGFYEGAYGVYNVAAARKEGVVAFIARVKPCLDAVHAIHRDELEELYERAFGNQMQVTITRRSDGSLLFDKRDVEM